MNSKIYNFGAGPSMLPPSVLQQVQEEFLDWRQTGMSILEVGHRSQAFLNLMEEIEGLLRDLLKIPPHYQVLFLGGPARMHFSMIPLNLMQQNKVGGYWITGHWSQMAYKEASRLAQTYCIASEEANGFLQTPPQETWKIDNNSAYLYFTPNETIDGLRFHPTVINDIPLVADMTSSLFTEPMDIQQYALIFAGAQKNIANAGLTLVIANPAVFSHNALYSLPCLLDYRRYLEDKMLATPPTFNCYLMGKMLEWMLQQGGLQSIHEQNRIKSAALYDYLDNSALFTCSVAKDARSLVNVCFSLRDTTLEGAFFDMAHERGLMALKGHRAKGGMRASLYNAMPFAGVQALITMMSDFESRYG